MLTIPRYNTFFVFINFYKILITIPAGSVYRLPETGLSIQQRYLTNDTNVTKW